MHVYCTFRPEHSTMCSAYWVEISSALRELTVRTSISADRRGIMVSTCSRVCVSVCLCMHTSRLHDLRLQQAASLAPRQACDCTGNWTTASCASQIVGLHIPAFFFMSTVISFSRSHPACGLTVWLIYTCLPCLLDTH